MVMPPCYWYVLRGLGRDGEEGRLEEWGSKEEIRTYIIFSCLTVGPLIRNKYPVSSPDNLFTFTIPHLHSTQTPHIDDGQSLHTMTTGSGCSQVKTL